MLTIACVRTGTKYDLEYVARLRAGVARHLDRPHRFICLTDQPTVPAGVDRVDIGHLGLPCWWGKMALFQPALRALSTTVRITNPQDSNEHVDVERIDGGRCIYLDLDSVIVGDLSPLADYECIASFGGDGWLACANTDGFAICESFTRLAGNKDWPCRYGSCAMVFEDGWGQSVWDAFWRDRARLMADCDKGDQQAIERLWPEAMLLQRELPPGFFLNKRDLPQHPDGPPAGASVVIFGGNSKPHNCALDWARRAWQGKRAAV